MTNKVFTAVPGTEVEVDNIPDLTPEESIEKVGVYLTQ